MGNTNDKKEVSADSIFTSYIEDIRHAKNQQWYVGGLYSALVGFLIANKDALNINARVFAFCLCCGAALLSIHMVSTYSINIGYYRYQKRYIRKNGRIDDNVHGLCSRWDFLESQDKEEALKISVAFIVIAFLALWLLGLSVFPQRCN